MKNYIAIITILLFAQFSQAQDKPYDKLWKQVQVLEMDNLPKSALKIVDQIEVLAKKDDNKPQQIKVLLFKSKFALILEEEAQLSIIKDFKTAISKNETPIKNVLENMLATIYWQYFQENRYKFYNRTKLNDKDVASDFRTWDLQTIFNEIQLLYKNSLKEGLALQQEDLKEYSSILIEQKGSKIYRPSLYDLLAHNALSFYQTTENSITKPAYKFEIDQEAYLSDSNSFSKLPITSQDSTSLELQALKLYQDLIKFHLKDKNPEALADVNILRYNFVKEHATFQNKDSLLLQAYKTEAQRIKTHEASGLYRFEIANIYFEQGQDYQPGTNIENRWKIKDAVQLCNSIIKEFPNSKAAKKSQVLLKQIHQESLKIIAENYLAIGQDAKILVTYKNINELDFSIYRISEKQFKTFNETYKTEDKLDFINKLRAENTWKSTLKNELDYQEHSSELLIPKLTNGRYLIVAKTNSKENTFAYKVIQATNIAVVEKNGNDKQLYQFIDRLTGEPLSNLQVEVTYFINYNENQSSNTYTTNDLGEIEFLKGSKVWYRIGLEATCSEEKAYFGNYHLNRRYTPNTYQEDYRGFVFTDRSIYRPGQTVYFKGIALKIEDGKSKVIPNELFYIEVYDSNENEIAELELSSNEFGSVSGEFILPNSGLNGNYSIEFYGDKNDVDVAHYFSVEEYKRPKFETKFNPITESFKVNDSITIKGHALAYAGSNITHAKVVYRVHRKVQYPRWYYWYRPAFYSEPQEITHGESHTNEKGEFEITFKAIPDSSVDKDNLPIFNYEVTADVTDLNGETRSATTIVNVGYHTLLASISLHSSLEKQKKDHKLTIDTKNLNGEFVPAQGTLKIYKLQAPEHVLRPRPWKAPDYQILSETEFKAKFPYEAYTNEDDANNWKKGELVLEKSFNTEKSKELDLGNIKKWESGQYVIVLESKDKFGQAVKDEARTTVYSDTDKTLSDNQLFRISTNKENYNIDDTVELSLASAAKDLKVTVEIEKNKETINTYVIPLNNNKKTISIPVNKADLGGFAVHYSYAYQNSFGSGTKIISVPYPKTDLEIETTTFRDKLQPGQDEIWSFKIKGPKGEQVSAELLASMYDMSLDQFKPHSWTFNPIQHPSYYSHYTRNARTSFSTEGFRIQNLNGFYLNYPQNVYDQLDWFGFSLTDSWARNRYLRNIRNTASYNSSLKSGVVSGTIYDENGLPLPGVNILIKGINKGTQTDFDGHFSLTTETGDVLVISFVGYTTKEYTIDVNNSFSLSMSPDVNSIDEVVVTALGVHREEKAMGYAPDNMLAESMEDSEALNEETITTNVPISKKEDFSQVQIRKNLQETAFFFPQLQTDEKGHVSFSFTTPEALSKWKLQLLAHTKTLESTTTTLETVTQKELMVLPNVPRFLRQGDQITISSKIANLTKKDLSGQAVLQLFDAINGKAIDADLGNTLNTKTFTVAKKGNTEVSWSLSIPDYVDAIQYKIIAKAGDYSDGEQNALPVLSNRMLVTETLSMWIRSNETRTFTLDKLKTNTSTTLKHHKLMLEMTSNPAWYAVQALPYLMEYPYDCNEQIFSRYYANSLASHIANSNPRIQEVFNQWRSSDALLSNLEKNQELKSILIEETPWLRDAQSETEQKKRIALLFDLNKMTSELQLNIKKLEQNQMGNGSWAWFQGGKPNRFITQHIISGFGHLNKLHVIPNDSEESMIKKAISYLDKEFVEEYRNITKYKSDVDLNLDHLSHTQVHYLYMRSFFPDIKKSKEVEKIIAYYQTQIKKYWTSRSLYSKGMMALISYRQQDKHTASKILKSLKENSITSDELGMYWKENTASWYWYQAPIETQALMIEVFAEVGAVIQSETKNLKDIDNLKMWLLKNKQTNSWKTTKATTEAVYALLLQGSDWLSVTDMVDVVIGGNNIEPSKLEDVKVEAGTGYYKTSWTGTDITPEMAEVTLTKKGEGLAWGALYWQYFEDLDKITSADLPDGRQEHPLTLKKKLFLKTNTDLGEEITEITENTELEIGDLVRVRIELSSDRAMEFLHMKDMRASGLEPVNVLSQYKWQDGLGYYESTKDASTNFFFDYLPKGVYVFEYDLRVSNAGNMSNGITSIQSMYAPEFSSHSKGIRISVD
ncbi:carboxypeptidase-like regulatory domain-containing protein [Xanthomarina sp. F1114]|uniref:alpha-2-macroglobulin family protein n=1 Tax=Xanthomarina sp. F1114 TaxID=2996019 RepID=UPI00225DE469|nr:carboxypeptidase-like regulatory domain-containing protein [Xanthomarina sp. F1114]MCX7547889.1 carboxypeptidase-like regulatory domain-containing protein [Xanthomarina sp. F1114]